MSYCSRCRRQGGSERGEERDREREREREKGSQEEASFIGSMLRVAGQDLKDLSLSGLVLHRICAEHGGLRSAV